MVSRLASSLTKGFLWASFILMLLTGCGNQNIVFEQVIKIPEQTWDYKDSLDFSFEIQDTTQAYDLYLDITHLESFSFQNLYLNMHSHAPELPVFSEQHSLELQEKTGEWIGACRKGKCELRFVLREGLRFPAKGAYKIQLEQYSRTERLPGIYAAGIVLQKAEK
jgi:gliding motility-associated lipoprotein GldH